MQRTPPKISKRAQNFILPVQSNKLLTQYKSPPIKAAINANQKILQLKSSLIKITNHITLNELFSY